MDLIYDSTKIQTLIQIENLSKYLLFLLNQHPHSMNIEELRTYCLSVPGTEECLPFDDVTLVYKVMGKMYALIPLDTETCSISVKCDPDKAIELREQYQAVQEAWHFNKKYWNTLLPGKGYGGCRNQTLDFALRR